MTQRTSSGQRAAHAEPSPGPQQASAASAPVELTGVHADRSQDASFARLARRVALRGLIVLAIVIVAGILGARVLAERAALDDATVTADVLAESAIQPTLTEGVVTRDPAALLAFVKRTRLWIEDSNLVRANLWRADGTIVWSDEPRLIDRTYALGAERREVLDEGETQASVADLSAEVNAYDRGRGELLQVLRPVRTPDGTVLLFEIYATSDAVDARASDLTTGFSLIMVSALLAFVVLLLPLLRQLTRGLHQARADRERLLEEALDASSEERRRIAGDLHDGVVQDLAATSFALSGAAARAGGSQAGLQHELEGAARTLRTSIASLRSLLVDIYPRSLERSGLAAALDDQAGTLRARGVDVQVEIDPDLDLDPEQERLVFRIVRECLHNVRRHARAQRVAITLTPSDDGDGAELRVSDDGIGFDIDEVRSRPERGHVGLQVMADVAERDGARLLVTTSPGAGCTWTLEIPA